MRVSVAYDRWPHHAARSGYPVLAEALAERVELRRLAPAGRVPDRLADWAVRRAGIRSYSRRSLAFELTAARGLCRGEICHLFYGEHTYRFLGAVRPAGRLSGGRILCSYHQPPELLRELLPGRRMLRRIDALVAFCAAQAECLASRAGAERVHVIPHAVDATHFRPPERAERDPALCLFVGSWFRDFDVLRAVIEQSAKRDSGLRFRVITEQARLAELGALPATEALAGVSDAELLASYQAAGILGLPLSASTGNNVLVEALACGLPIVATDIGGVREHTGEDAAALVPPHDARAMLDALLAISSDGPRRERMGAAARTRALELDIGPVADRYVELYRSIA